MTSTELSGDTFGAIVELNVNIEEPASVIKSSSYPKISFIAEGNLSRGFFSTPIKAILEVKPSGKKAGTGYVIISIEYAVLLTTKSIK
jgi:hypothetical protein